MYQGVFRCVHIYIYTKAYLNIFGYLFIHLVILAIFLMYLGYI